MNTSRRAFLKRSAVASVVVSTVAIPALAEDSEVTPEEIIADFHKQKERLENKTKKDFDAFVPDVVDYCNKRTLTNKEALNLSEFMYYSGPDKLMFIWNRIARGSNSNTIKVHGSILKNGKEMPHVILQCILLVGDNTVTHCDTCG